MIAGFKIQRNPGEKISPSKPVRIAPPQGRGLLSLWSTPCLHQSGALQQVQFGTSIFDQSRHFIRKRVDCSTPNVVYYILCDCQHPADYIGSTKSMKSRWSTHKSDIRGGQWTKCGLTAHFGQYHRWDMEQAICGHKVTLVDIVAKKKDLKRSDDSWMCNLSTLFVGLNSINKFLTHSRVKFGAKRGAER